MVSVNNGDQIAQNLQNQLASLLGNKSSTSILDTSKEISRKNLISFIKVLSKPGEAPQNIFNLCPHQQVNFQKLRSLSLSLMQRGGLYFF